MIKGDRNHWGSLAKFFHWTVVVLILVQATVGLIMVGLPRRPSVISVYNFHKSIGLTILALAVLRLVWRMFDKRPEEPASMTRVQSIAARVGHALLYVLLFLVPLSGWWFDSVTSLRPLYWFGLIQVPPLGGPDPSIPGLKELARSRHEWLFWALTFVAAGHALAALFHQFVIRDNVLGRMWPASLQRKPKPNRVESNPERVHVAVHPHAVVVDPVDPDSTSRSSA
jgi:cytochrome b561